jgi:hypothetical protein
VTVLRAEDVIDVERRNRAGRNGSDPAAYHVAFDKNGKLVLPEPPPNRDAAGQCRWLTSVFNLDPSRPITGGRREGLRGPEGHIALTRADAPAIRFEPASKMNTPAKLIETLTWRMIDTDGAVHALTGAHCRQITYVVRMLCGAHEAMTEADEAIAIVGDFMLGAVAVEGLTSYGNGQQRYEAAVGLRRETDEATGRPIGPTRYLIDAVIPTRRLASLSARARPSSGSRTCRNRTAACRLEPSSGVARRPDADARLEADLPGWSPAPGKVRAAGTPRDGQRLSRSSRRYWGRGAVIDTHRAGDQVTKRFQPPTRERRHALARAYSVGNGLVTWSREPDLVGLAA